VKRLLFIFLFFTLGIGSVAQEGNYYITNFTPSNYGANDQNWSVIQDSLGRIIVANLSSFIVYDGKHWRNDTILGNKSCVSLAKDENGKIYIGGGGEFGYLDIEDKRNKGAYVYRSMSSNLPEKEREFGNVWSIQAIKNDVFFCSNERVFWYHNGKFKYSFTPTGEKFHTFFTVGNTLVIREQGVGMMFFKDGVLKKILGSGELADIRIYSILPLKDNLYWLCSRNGLYTMYFNPNQPEISNFAKANSPIDSWMIENDIYCGAKLNDNLFALGSIKKGMILVDQNCKIHNSINYEKGLQDDAVKFIYKDYAGNIWLALNKGVSHAEINTPLTHWAKTNGIQGVIESVAKYKGIPYIATDKGVEKLNIISNSFETTGITDEGWDLQTYKDVLLVGTNVGLFEIDEKGHTLILDAPDGIFKIFIDPKRKEILYLAGRTTLSIAKYQNHKIQILKTFEDVIDIRSIVVNGQGSLYFGSISSLIYYYDPQKPDTLITFSDREGLPSQSELYVFKFNDEILVCADTAGIYTFKDTPGPHFIREKKYNVSTVRRQTNRAIQCGKDIWLASSLSTIDGAKVDELVVLQKEKDGFILDYKLLKRIRELSAKCFLIDSEAIFIGTNDGLIEYNVNHISKNYRFNTLIYKVATKFDTSAIVYNYSNGYTMLEPEIVFKDNDIRFFAAANDYYDKNELEFSYYLEGRDTSFGEWSKNNRIVYTALHEGHYTFHIKSRNILGAEGKPVSFSFTILPPWYRTYWAYALYLIGAVGLIWFIVAYNTRRLKEQNIKLEQIITERTKEIEHQKGEIEHKNQEITDSINYAKRIQQAILPPVHEIIKVWSDLFVFYQPKDIVSGDFYWFNKINDHEILIACADCTGHGVPGGFMSMICSDKLTDAVKITHDPEKILFHVNNNVKKALRQTESSDENVNKDGMEISLVRVNFKTRQVWFAGANRPLWILKKDSEEIEEIKPTKASIASFTQTDFEYQGHEIQLEKGDLVYMTSDGYPDQFGGADGKKFMTKNFKKLILSIKQLGMREQETTVMNVINQWKEGYEQVDDLLVIAFKL